MRNSVPRRGESGSAGVKHRGIAAGFGRPAARRLLLISGAVAAVSLAGGIAVLSLAGNSHSPAESGHSAAPSSSAAVNPGVIGDPGVIGLVGPDGVVAVVANANQNGSEQAVVSGRLEKLPGGCVGLVGDGGNVVVVWPAGTTFSEDSTGLDVPLYGAIRYGSQFRTAGGYVTIEEWVHRAELPPDCDATDVAHISAWPD